MSKVSDKDMELMTSTRQKFENFIGPVMDEIHPEVQAQLLFLCMADRLFKLEDKEVAESLRVKFFEVFKGLRFGRH